MTKGEGGGEVIPRPGPLSAGSGFYVPNSQALRGPAHDTCPLFSFEGAVRRSLPSGSGWQSD